MGTGIFLPRGSDEEIPPEARIFATEMTPVEEARLHGDPISSGGRMLYEEPILAGEGTPHRETIFRDEIAQSGPSWLELPLWLRNWVGEPGQRKAIAVADQQDRDRQDRDQQDRDRQDRDRQDRDRQDGDRQDRSGVARKVAAGAGKVAGATVWRGVQEGHTVAGAVGLVPQNPPETVWKVTRADGKATDQDNDQVVNGSHHGASGSTEAVSGSHRAVNGVSGVVSADLGAVGLVADGGRPQVARLMRPMARGAVSNGVEDQGEQQAQAARLSQGTVR